MTNKELSKKGLEDHEGYWKLMIEQVGNVPIPYELDVIVEELKKGNLHLHGKGLIKDSKVSLNMFDRFVPMVKGYVVSAKRKLLDEGEEYKSYSISDCICMMKSYARQEAMKLFNFNRNIEFEVPSELYGSTTLVVNIEEYMNGRSTFPCGDGCDITINSHNDIDRGGSYVIDDEVCAKIKEEFANETK